MRPLQARDNEIGTLKSARRHFSRTRCYPNPGIHPDLLPFDWEREQPLLRERAERMQPNRYASCANHAQIEELTAVQTDAPLGAWHRVIGRMFSMAPARSVYDDAPDALAFVHQVEPLVDVRQWHGVGDHRIDLDLWSATSAAASLPASAPVPLQTPPVIGAS